MNSTLQGTNQSLFNGSEFVQQTERIEEESCGLEWFHSDYYPDQPQKDLWKEDCKTKKNLSIVPDHYIRCFCGAPESENKAGTNCL